MRRIPELILPWNACLALAAVLLIVAGSQIGVRHEIDAATMVQPKATCTLAGWDYHGNGVQMNLHCGPQESWTDSARFINRYLQQHPGGQFTCSVTKTNAAEGCSYTPPK